MNVNIATASITTNAGNVPRLSAVIGARNMTGFVHFASFIFLFDFFLLMNQKTLDDAVLLGRQNRVGAIALPGSVTRRRRCILLLVIKNV